ncbi:hypothetical protein BCR42DRAFT_406327 [Absidia repens]|uniref:C2H2-type domain-containing protein n=1 Tax=Absidia repens TaxID=90262 RepID=A0A1X2IUN5_9FUNG|nr:hypothetical protein BCR42DRAFT_406327 [Absidia repens]
MTSSTQRKQRSSKVFQCSGYGDCKMVFTRGEHLARHKRKHTGEKPFPCVVPDCSKSFSRFDNMIQHTQTHRKDPQQCKLSEDQRYQHQYQHQLTIAKSMPFHERNHKVILHQPSSVTTRHHTTSQAQENSSICLPENHAGSESPVSLASVSMMDSASSDEDDDEDDDSNVENAQYYHHDEHVHWMDHSYRQLSVADMCNPMVAQQSLKMDQLTSDEVEAIQAFGKLRQATC